MKIRTRWVVFDVEADSLQPTKFHCLSYHTFDGKKGSLTTYDDIRDFFRAYDVYVGHNIRRWDLPQLERVVGIEVPGRVVDTLALSWYLSPKRRSHGLEDIGLDYGIQKPGITDWESLSLSTYINRCETDVRINVSLWNDQQRVLDALYEDHNEIWRFLGYIDFKMRCAVLQEKSGWKLDREKCEEGIEVLSKIYQEKIDELTRVMPRVPVVAVRNKPKVYRKRDGELSSAGIRWHELLERHGLPDDHDGPVEEITGYDEPNPGSSQQVKEWLYSFGWVPQTIKYQRNKTTGEMKEIPQVNREKQKGGGVCESVKMLFEKEPKLELLEGVGVLQHRLGILRGFLRDVTPEGYLYARVAGFTNTFRFKHSELVNLPKLDAPYAEYIRASLIAPDDEHELCGSDMAGVEDRIKQHYLWEYDAEYVRTLLSEDYDPHIDIAVLAGMMTPEEGEAYKAGDHSKKSVRSIAKNGNYACQYGAGVSRIALTCGISHHAAQNLYDAYWERNWAIKEVAKNQTVKRGPVHTVLDDGTKFDLWLWNPVSEFWYTLRYQKDIFSTLVQGTAAYVFDLWLMEIAKRRPQFTGQFHDEVILTVKKGHREHVEKFLRDCIANVNTLLGLNRELDIDIQFGHRYSEIH